MGGKSLQGPFKETNKLCQQCIKDCKQFENVTVIKCDFVSNQNKGGTLQAQRNTTCRGEYRVKEPKVAKTGVGMGQSEIPTLPLAESAKTRVSEVI